MPARATSSCGLLEALGGTSDRLDLAVVEIADLGAVLEQHPIALPVEAVREDDLALGADRDAVHVDDRANLVVHPQIELIRVGRGEGVGLPVLHRPPFCLVASPTRDSVHTRLPPRSDSEGQRYTRPPVKSSVETLEGNKVKLYVEVDEAEFDHDIDRAFKLIAKEVNLPGFRAGKAPRKVLEARIGVGVAREQALRDAVPQYLAKAVREHAVDLIATPEVEITDGAESGPVEFDATCEVRPTITLDGYGDLRVELPPLEVTDDDLAVVHEAELKRTATLADADRPAEPGDYLTVDLAATRDGEELSGLNTEDWSYELGQGWVTDDFDEHLTGASVGDEITFTSTPKGLDEAADFVVKVSAVQVSVVPELTDDWVADNIGEFDTVDEWNASLRESQAGQKLDQARQRVVPAMNAALAELVAVDVPDAMVDADLNQRVHGVVQQFQAQGIDLGQWLAATGQGPDDFIESMRGASVEAVKVDLALRAVADAESIEVEPHDFDAEYARMAMQYGQKAKDIRKAYEQNEAVPELAAQIRKSKAFDWLLHHIEFVDPDGNAINRDTLLGHSHDHDDDAHDDDGGDVDVRSAAAAVIAATDAAATAPAADEPDADQPADSSSDLPSNDDSEEETS
jgi:trigger factor